MVTNGPQTHIFNFNVDNINIEVNNIYRNDNFIHREEWILKFPTVR